jgi:uncharacterized protein YlzI (FlbEa/FlbD family)
MLKLTTPNGGNVYINPAHIVAVERNGGRHTTVWMVNGCQQAAESVAQIMAALTLNGRPIFEVRPEEEMSL